MLKTILKVAVACALLVLLGLGAEVSGVFGSSLSCSDKKVTDLVEKIYRDRMPDKSETVTLHNISTERNLDSGGKTCLADLTMKAESEPTESILKAEYSYEERDDRVVVTSRIKLF